MPTDIAMKNLEIVLVEPVYSGNIGASARSAYNFGIGGIRIVGKPDIRDIEAKKMALYGYEMLNQAAHYDSLKEAVSDRTLVIGTVHQVRYHRAAPRPLWETMHHIRARIRSEPAAIVFGREDNGLTREEIDCCHLLAVIPSPENMSFNLAHAVTVCLYEAYKTFAGTEPSLRPRRPAHGDIESLMTVAEKALQAIRFFRGDQYDSTLIALRDILYRSDLNASDIPLLKAVLYKIIKQIRFLENKVDKSA